MDALAWIVLGGVAMSAIALVGSLTLCIDPATLDRLLLPLVAFAAGALLGGAFFHMLPGAQQAMDDPLAIGLWTLTGFTAFFALEQFLRWRHCQRPAADRREPLGWLMLIGDGVHNFLGGLAIGGAFIVDIRLGITSWLAAAAHEVPQELGDFGVLVHAGWSRRRALVFNVLSALTFLIGGLVAWAAAARVDVSGLLPLAAGNFIYIASSDLVPEITRQRGLARGLVHLGAFVAGLGLLYALAALS